MWGTLSCNVARAPRNGITPTCVGNTDIARVAKRRYKDHPHLCGEHSTHDLARRQSLGSPPPVWGTRGPCATTGQTARITPPVWGTLKKMNCLYDFLRITPTCVGNTIKYAVQQQNLQDHPHLCGEHCFRASLAAVRAGSPPPVWGTQV